METPQQRNDLFEFGIDHEAKGHLLETARWGKFLAVVGFIMMGLLLIFSIVAGAIMSKLASGYGGGFGALSGGAISLLYIIIIALYTYPIYSLYKFSTMVKSSLIAGDQARFNTALGHLKSMFKYIGILTLIVLCLYGIVFLFMMIGLMMR